MSDSAIQNEFEDIAVIGMAGRFPGAGSIEKFWRNVRDAVDSITKFSDEELEASGINRATRDAPNYIRAGGVLEDAEFFDASFFGLTAREAEIIDPQHRVFLESAWEALEDAGYDAETYAGSIGVFAGVSFNGYLLNFYRKYGLTEAADVFQAIIGNEKDHLATRVSYKLNLKGPSINVQSACSTSLVAVSLACQSLLLYQSDMALAGGVAIKVPQQTGYVYQEGGILSSDGCCRAFDARAEGTVSGNGVGIVVLKRLSEAIADGDYIHAVIKGSAINNDGAGKVGYTAPSEEAQAEVIAEAMQMARVEAESITYVETHGTGTVLGDPIEISALTKAFRSGTAKKHFCAIGSVKTNIGHLDTAAGVAGLIKTVEALKHRQLPPSLHFERPNPGIDFARSPFYVNTVISDWKAGRTPRRAGVSSFGIGGTNAHVIVEEAPARGEVSGASKVEHLLILSAKTGTALETATANLAAHLRQHPEINLADVAYTLQVGRRVFSHRRALVCRDIDDAANALETLNPQRIRTEFQEHKDSSVVMMFPGQGTQYVNMASSLYESVPAFREQVDLCSELLIPALGLDLRKVLYPAPEQVADAAAQVGQTFIAQPALFVIEYALAKMWMKWGVRPRVMIGHSIGEYVAACLAGVFSVEDALTLVAMRGRLMQQLPAGAMLAVPLPETEVLTLMDDELSIAAVNSPSQCVVSGAEQAVNQFADRLEQKNISCQPLRSSHAFHSKMMDSIINPFTEQVGKVKLHAPRIPYISGVTGRWITEAEAMNPVYWGVQLRQPVRFAQGVEELLKEPERILLEVGTGQTLSAIIRQRRDKTSEPLMLATVAHPSSRQQTREERTGTAFLLDTLGQLWLAGVCIDWAGVDVYEERRRVSLPTYPFERRRYLMEVGEENSEAATSGEPAGQRREPDDWFYLPLWKQTPPAEVLEHLLPTDERSCWLVFADGCGLAVQLVEHLERNAQDVFTVQAGECFAADRAGAYTINPRRGDDYKALLNAIRETGRHPETIVHAWNVTAENPQPPADELRAGIQEQGFDSLLLLAQALGEQNSRLPVRIAVVSNNMQKVVGTEALSPEKATILGACRVIPLEYPNVSCRSIDVLPPPQATEAERSLGAQLFFEISAVTDGSPVAYRGGQRWTQIFEPVRLERRTGRATRLREGGVYLITGGLSDVGSLIAEHLARQVRASLLLLEPLSRPAQDDPAASLSNQDEREEMSRKIAKVQALEALGAEVIVLNADLTDEQAMQSVVAQARRRFGEINGVIHTQEVRASGLIQLRSPEMTARILSPQVRAALVLDSLFKNAALDFFVLFSSSDSMIGGLGVVDRCAASAFLDAYAHARSAVEGRQTISIGWGDWLWADWREAMFANLPETQTQLRQRRETFGITPQECVEVLNHILSASLAHVIVSPQNFQTVIEQQKAFTTSSLLEDLEMTRRAASATMRRERSDAYVAPRNPVEQAITGIWQEVFGLEQVGIHDNFFDLGGNSLVGLQLMSRVRKAFEIEMPMRVLFDSPTVSGLAAFITDSQLKEQELEEIERLIKEIQELSPEDLQTGLI